MFKLLNTIDTNDLTYIISFILCFVMVGVINLYVYHKIYDKLLCIGASKSVSSGIALLGTLSLTLIILEIYYIII